VMIGHNERIAWGMTNTNPDVNDLYVEHANPMNPDEYRVGDTWVPMDVRYEVVRVHGWDEPLALRVRSTRHGPIINDPAAGDDWAFGWQPLAMRWTGNAPGMMVQAVLAMNRAGNWEAFRAALRGFDVPSQNVVYADVEGNIGYQMTGRIPIRARGLGALPVPGWTDEYAWVGTIAYDDLPRALNPTDGAIVTANNRVTDAGYPYHLGSDWNRGLRAARIAQMLSAQNAVSIADCCAVQDDALVTYAHGILRNLEAVIPKDRRAAEAVEILRRWDRRADADAVAPAVFAVWHMHLVREVFGDELGDDVLDRYLFNASVPVLDALDNALNGEGAAWCDDVRTPGMERCAQIVARAFDRAVDELTDRLGPSVRAWRWGRLHQVTFIHPTMGRAGVGLLEVVANRGPMAVGGTCDTVKNVCFDPRRPYTAELLPTYRQIIDVGAWENSVAVNSTGQSGHPFHRHYTDMIRLWREGTYHPMLWHRDDIAREASAVLVIEPVEAVGGRDGGPSAGSR
jgi:penicillin amidase